ncbi:hypothetical protein NUU61_001831 [Penicillium alfredii]|uniref:Spindle pole body-associated protein cut12 domain-containing protein n=1 Tax=Penicillium alfredii TaxID=1506179 RepID=A0A9W9FQD9_9EURO|nr:uncharacterized protein NUU61_001831 [Penicillium alfredii]KAJ5104484.1 hypothetical protein NUU61_001831 [Penicillium alfredii]
MAEPPETPAPVFAIRAFKSALFGTPGGDEADESRASQPKQANHQHSKSDSVQPLAEKTEDMRPADDDAANNAPGSPTKSILVTPGTISNRRKTVSFGESVVDNEGKRDSLSSKVVKTPPNPAGNITAQWMSGSSDGKKPRSKLTQTLLDARDNASKNAESDSEEESSSDAKPATRSPSRSKEEPANEDITLNLEDPRSESGKYWKTEFDNYRVRTNQEIKKLIQYRSIAKSYARKKDTEALRLADKLREEEEKVTEMERQVSRLASTMVGEESKANKEELVQDLSKQTALALQYKQQVTSLRKVLERHDVLGGEVADITAQPKGKSHSENSSDELLKAQQELRQANAKIEEMKRQQSDLSTLQDLAQSSEKKAQALENENNTLKQTLARVKQEMSRYEGRRKDKETKLKQREVKLEARIQEYRERLKTASKEHRESEEMLRNNFEEEHRRLQNQLNLMRLGGNAAERFPLRSHNRRSLSPRKEYADVETCDFAEQDAHELGEDATEDLDGPPSPSPRSKARETRHSQNTTTSVMDGRHGTRDIAADEDEVTHYLNEILPKPQHASHPIALHPLPPSSPPDVLALKTLGYLNTRNQPSGQGQRSHRTLGLREADTSGRVHRPRPHIKSTLDSISGLPVAYTENYSGNTIAAGDRTGQRQGLSGVQSTLLSPERVAAAKYRLKQKQNKRKSRALDRASGMAVATSTVDTG